MSTALVREALREGTITSAMGLSLPANDGVDEMVERPRAGDDSNLQLRRR